MQESALGSPVGNVKELIGRLQRKATSPLEIFREHLSQYKEVPPAEWGAHFPLGYRERVAPEFLSDVYSQNKKGEEWAKDFLRDRELLDCFAARELMAALSALDAILLVERCPGSLNRVSTEKLARKAYAFYVAFHGVRRQADWKKPKGDQGKAWKSKIDWEAAKRYDHTLTDDEIITISGAEAEVRREMERDALMLKMKSKLEERAGSGIQLQGT